MSDLTRKFNKSADLEFEGLLQELAQQDRNRQHRVLEQLRGFDRREQDQAQENERTKAQRIAASVRDEQRRADQRAVQLRPPGMPRAPEPSAQEIQERAKTLIETRDETGKKERHKAFARYLRQEIEAGRDHRLSEPSNAADAPDAKEAIRRMREFKRQLGRDASRDHRMAEPSKAVDVPHGKETIRRMREFRRQHPDMDFDRER